MSPWLLALIFAILAIVFPCLSFLFLIKKTGGASGLEASVQFLNIALPTLLFILGALGFTSYEAVVNKVTDRVTKESKIDSLVNEIKKLNQQARIYTESILSMEKKDRNKILSIADTSFLRMLPQGTIIPYKGAVDNIDLLYWAICDGTSGTPDLIGKFILGKDRNAKPDSSSTALHLQLSFSLQNIQINEISGAATTIKIPKEITRRDRNTDPLPPYYALVYLMKIK